MHIANGVHIWFVEIEINFSTYVVKSILIEEAFEDIACLNATIRIV